MTLYPWLEPAAAQLKGAHAAGRLPPALLIHEAPGTGARQLATLFAQLRFCTGASVPCGACTHCRRVAQGEGVALDDGRVDEAGGGQPRGTDECARTDPGTGRTEA